MHKIKEMLHKDSEDSSSSSSHQQSGGSGQHMKEEVKDKLHMNKDSDSSSMHAHSHDHAASHAGRSSEHHSHHEERSEHMHNLEHKHQHGSSGEKHVYHEREHIKGDMYREGVDPTIERDVLVTDRHQGEVSRERVGEAKVVKESIKEVELHKVQPVIHRDREQKEIRHVVAPEHKFEVKDTEVHHRERDIDLGVRREASTLETDRSMGMPKIEATHEHLGKDRQHQELPTKVEEHVSRKVEEHIHPVVYKEVLKPKVTEETHHLYEKVKEAPIETYEVKDIDRSRGNSSCLNEAEREFFARETSRGITMESGGHHHQHVHEHDHLKSHGDKASEHVHHAKHSEHKMDESHHKTHHKDIDIHKHEAIHSHPQTVMSSTQEPIIGHHQNIGAHHLPAAAVPAGHNTAYDAALAAPSASAGSAGGHSARDAELMNKMQDKHIAEQQQSS